MHNRKENNERIVNKVKVKVRNILQSALLSALGRSSNWIVGLVAHRIGPIRPSRKRQKLLKERCWIQFLILGAVHILRNTEWGGVFPIYYNIT